MPSDRFSTPHYVAPVTTSDVSVDAIRIDAKPSSRWRDAWADLRRRPTFWVTLAVLLVVILMALVPTLFTQTPPNNQCFLDNSNAGPAPGHPLGFTFQGCDIWSRIVWGAQTSLLVGFLATLIGTTIGLVMGSLAGFYGGWLDGVLSRIGDIFFAIPYILAAIVVMSVFSANRTPLVLAFAIGGFAWAGTARVIRAEVLRVRQADFVTASRALGLSRFRTLVSHVLPNALAPVLVIATLTLGAAIAAEATLSFLGVGLGSDTMSWGLDISQAQASLRVAPMALIYPSIALSVTILSFIILGELLRDALDPKARARR